MTQVTAVSRCTGQNHVHITVVSPRGTKNFTFTIQDLTAVPLGTDLEERALERIKLLVREAQAVGNTTYTQIRTYILNREFVE